MLTRRELIGHGAAGTAGVLLGGALLDGSVLAAPPPLLQPYVDSLPLLVDNAIDATAGGTVNLSSALVSRKVHRDLPPTKLFGYLRSGGPGAVDPVASYLGPAVVAKTGVPVRVRYTNALAPNDYLRVFTNHGSRYLQFAGAPEVRTMAHLHGGFVAGADDGNPYQHPSAFRTGTVQTVMYPNEQPASLIWYHDHYMGDTRMNVVAGLAGGYLIRDEFDTGTNPLLPGPLGKYELPLVVQDRQFTAGGALHYPTHSRSENGPWIGEYFGDVMLVNGKVWPDLLVEPAVYRFRVLNGCNARILKLKLHGVPMHVIGAEGGLLPRDPVAVSELTMTPAERLDVICDFRGLAGRTVLLTNSEPTDPVSCKSTLSTSQSASPARPAANAPPSRPAAARSPSIRRPLRPQPSIRSTAAAALASTAWPARPRRSALPSTPTGSRSHSTQTRPAARPRRQSTVRTTCPQWHAPPRSSALPSTSSGRLLRSTRARRPVRRPPESPAQTRWRRSHASRPVCAWPWTSPATHS